MGKVLPAIYWAGPMIARSYWWFGMACMLAVLATALPVSRLAYSPGAVEIVEQQLILERNFPGDSLGLPRPSLSYVETVKPISQDHNGGHACTMRGGPMQYTRSEPVGRWSLEWASDCLSDPLGFIWSSRWTWHLGMIQFGPVSASHRVLRDPCQFRVSTRGLIHERGQSEWFDQTSNTHCFATRAEAEAFAEEIP